MTSNQDKTPLRSRLREARRSLSAAERQQKSVTACEALRQSELFSGCQSIAVYMAHDGELDPQSLAQAAWQEQKSVYLPVVAEKALLFREYRQDDLLHSNRYGIPEPSELAATLPLEDLDLLVLPLVGFDHSGTRLGMGGGYYDRALALARGEGPTLVGAGFECQRTETLPREDWDKQIDCIVTENGLLRCSQSAASA